MFLYILECGDKSFYTGVAKDIVTRINAHYNKSKQAAKYTKSRGVTCLKALWETDEHTARSAEVAIKRLTKKEKEAFILEPKNAANYLNLSAENLEIKAFSEEELKEIYIRATK